MRVNHAAHGGIKLLPADPRREAHDERNIVLHRIGPGLAFGVYALLREAETAGFCRSLLLLRGFRLCLSRIRLILFEKAIKDLVLDALDGALRYQLARIKLYVEALVDLHRETDAGYGAEAEVSEYISDAKLRCIDDAGDDLLQFLFEYVQRRGGRGIRSFRVRFRLGLRKSPLVDLAVLVQRNAVDLHGYGRHHIGRLALPDEIIESGDVHFAP